MEGVENNNKVTVRLNDTQREFVANLAKRTQGTASVSMGVRLCINRLMERESEAATQEEDTQS